jgi:predicted DNA-binding transcriptional regulator AlpA
MDLLTQRQAAEFTGLSQRTLERHRCTGIGPKFVRLGFYRRADLEAWIANCTYGSTSEADSKTGRRSTLAACVEACDDRR